MPTYDDSIPIAPQIAAFHAEEIEDFARPGTWLSGEERIAVVQATRNAREGAQLQSPVEHDAAPPEDVLPEAVLHLIERLACRAETRLHRRRRNC